MDLLLALVAAFAVVPAQSARNLNSALAPKDWLESRLSPRILDGNEAEAHSIPYQAYVETHYKELIEPTKCGGILISGDYVLTAASCVRSIQENHQQFKATQAEVILGAHNINESEPTQQKFNSTDFTLHEEFNTNCRLNNDIALIKLPETVSFDENIKPVALPKKSDASNTYEGKLGRASGWGFARGKGGSEERPSLAPVKFLNVMKAPVVSNKKCSSSASDRETITPTNICTSGKESGMGFACYRDTGGPLTIDGTLVGIISQNGKCQRATYSLYTRVTGYLDWIQSNTGIEIQ